MPRNLSVKQRKFAALVAGGATQTSAYEEAGYGSNGKRATWGRNARRLLTKAEVRAEIEELRLQMLPATDIKAAYEHALTRMIQLSNQDEDKKVSYAAAQWVREETGKLLAERERLEKPMRVPDAPVETVISQLRVLYAKALGAEPSLVEVVPEKAGEEQAGEAPAENPPQDAAAPEDAAEMPEPEEARPEYRIVPGRFPPQRVRVR
jgi:hypothetical protein